MIFEITRSVLVVRPEVPGQHVDRTQLNWDPGAGGPSVPSGWSSARQGDTNWYQLREPSNERILCYVANRALGRVLCACFGSESALAVVESGADLALPAREAWRRRNESAIKTYLRYWPTLGCDGFERIPDGEGQDQVLAFSGVRRVLDEGGQLPDWQVSTLPWNLAPDGSLTTQALARFRVTGFAGVDTISIRNTLAGLSCISAFEDEEDLG